MELVNLNNYGRFVDLVETGFTILYTKDLTNENIDDMFFSILNILRDGIEDEYVQNMRIEVIFMDNEHITLSIFDLFFNLIMWKLPLSVRDTLTSEFLFFDDAITRKTIKRYIDSKFLNKHRTSINNIRLNQIIDDTLYKFKYIDDFSFYLFNTVNNEDTIALMNEERGFWECLHSDLTGVPLDQVKDIGMSITNESIRYIVNSDHCLADSFRAGEGINPKQYKEVLINVGTKPDGNGGVFNEIINSSLSNGGLRTLSDNFIDASVARLAEILKKENVGDSGHFSRVLGLNNQSTRLHPDPDYVCNTKSLQKVYIGTAKILDKFKNRYYRLRMDGPEYLMSSEPTIHEKHLIGTTLYFRSPMGCASHSHGKGICYRCYGNLAYTNADINIGKISAEILSSDLTQKLLSAKHLLEAKVVSMKWVDSFKDFFDLSFNIILIKEGLEDLKRYKLIIRDINQENENDNFDYNDYINEFEVETPTGELYRIYTERHDNIYISTELNDIISRSVENDDGSYSITFDILDGINIFLMKLSNDDISKTLEDLDHMINRLMDVNEQDKDSWLQNLIEIVIEGGVDIDAVHLEVILSNQIRSVDDITDTPYWEYENEPYRLLTLSQSLTNNPNICTTMVYDSLPKTLVNPLSFKRTKSSELDLFFMEQPQGEMNVQIEDPHIKSDKDEKIPLMKAVSRVEKNQNGK